MLEWAVQLDLQLINTTESGGCAMAINLYIANAVNSISWKAIHGIFLYHEVR